MKRCVGILIALAWTTALSSYASAAVTVVRHLPGYKCMSLNLSPHQMMDPSVLVSVYSRPSTKSTKLGTAGATVAAVDPIVPRNGFVEVLFPSGKLGWIQSTMLKPWRPAIGTNGKCLPAQLSNGRLGFDYIQ